jgi:hypothetical protein
MSKSVEKALEREPAEPQSVSVFDFLYCDTRRIGSFLAQFDDAGHLERVIQRESATKGARRGFKLQVGGGATLAGTGASGNVGVERGPQDEGTEASERVYDPLWTNARTFLDYIEDRNLLIRDLSKTRLGQFVIASGTLAIFDLAILKQAWTIPSIKKMILAGISAHEAQLTRTRQQQQRLANKDAKSIAMNAGIDMFALLPHTIQAAIKSDNGTCWTILKEDSMIVPGSDVLLKYGIELAGKWDMVGILDSYPQTDDTVQIEAASTITGLWQVISQMAPAIRGILGKPNESYGLTPLLIFREVSG